MLNKIRGLAFFFLIFFPALMKAQSPGDMAPLLQKLDSVRNSLSISRHFAGIYFETTIHAVHFFSEADIKTQSLMERMEKRFADYFFRSADAHESRGAIPAEWKAYYQDTTASSLRYVLYGINAHINGDIWQALTAEFTAEEIKTIKEPYFLYYRELLKEYENVYEAALTSNPRIRLLHQLSFGFDKFYGKIMLHRWRKRQMQLADLYFNDRLLFERKLRRLQRKMSCLNRLIRRNT